MEIVSIGVSSLTRCAASKWEPRYTETEVESCISVNSYLRVLSTLQHVDNVFFFLSEWERGEFMDFKT